MSICFLNSSYTNINGEAINAIMDLLNRNQGSIFSYIELDWNNDNGKELMPRICYGFCSEEICNEMVKIAEDWCSENKESKQSYMSNPFCDLADHETGYIYLYDVNAIYISLLGYIDRYKSKHLDKSKCDLIDKIADKIVSLNNGNGKTSIYFPFKKPFQYILENCKSDMDLFKKHGISFVGLCIDNSCSPYKKDCQLNFEFGNECLNSNYILYNLNFCDLEFILSQIESQGKTWD